MQTAVAVLFALLAAASNALATALQRYAARTVPLSRGFRPALLVELLHRPVWFGGFAAVVAAACFQALALLNGELSLVQPLFVLELPFALLIGGLVLGRRLPRPGWAAVACIVAGLGTALWAASPTPGVQRPETFRWVLVLAGCAAAVAVLAGTAVRRPAGALRAACFGAAAAIGYALTAALMKDATHTWAAGGPGAFFTAWQTYGFAAAGVGALFLLQNAMQSGPLAASQPALTLGDALVSLSLGVALFEEELRDGWWLLPQVLGALLVFCGAVGLSRVPLTRTLVAPDSDRPASVGQSRSDGPDRADGPD
ncbi:DMT family transporter [Streptomyces sp. NPDC001380]|uniref:DMT family transporter n=1 Tax=Streptomyces sp. NPDC001380 TaxID=3364566 RepID=UPI0036B4CE84